MKKESLSNPPFLNEFLLVLSQFWFEYQHMTSIFQNKKNFKQGIAFCTVKWGNDSALPIFLPFLIHQDPSWITKEMAKEKWPDLSLTRQPSKNTAD